MKSVVVTQPGSVAVVDAEVPALAAGDALLRIKRVGLCGTDLTIFRGANPMVEYPRVIGHEIGAVIEAVGADVPAEWSIGREVLVVPYNSCGRCTACRQERFNCCRENQTLGVQQDGALCEYFTTPWQKLMAAAKLSLRELPLVEPLSIGFHACRRGRIAASDTVAVLGCGAIGLGAIAGAAFRDARVIAVDVDDAKLALAAKCGAAETINSRREALHERLQDITAGHGPDAVVEAIGLPETYVAAVEEVCYAGRVVYIGYAKAPVEYATKLFVLKELDILGSRNALAADFADAIAVLEADRFPVDDVITHSAPLAETGEMLRRWDADPGEFTKIQIEL